MKKLATQALIVLVTMAWTLPVFALEHQFGGYWRTRFFTQQQFTGDNRNDRIEDADGEFVRGDQSRVDTRTRLFYTAKLNDKLAFVNKFE